MKIIRTAFCAGVLLPCALLAQDEETDTLDPVVVTATRTEVSLAQSTAAVILITRDDIARMQAIDIAEILRFHAGLEVARQGGTGQPAQLFIRGGDSDQVLFLLDGMPVPPGIALRGLSPETIERIEIAKGPRSTLYGSDAMAGVVNLISRQGDINQAQVRLRGGSANTQDAAGFFGWNDGRSGVSAQAQQMRTDGIPPLVGQSEDRGHRQANVNLSGRTSYEEVELSARLWSARGDTQSTDAFADLLEQDSRDRVLAVEGSWLVTDDWESTLSFSHTESKAERKGSEDFVRSTRPQLDWLNIVLLGETQRLSVAAMTATEKYRALNEDVESGGDSDLFSLAVQDEILLGAHHLVLALSLHDNEDFGTAETWNAEYGYDLSPHLRLVAATGTAYRTPDAEDFFGFTGNVNLTEETARNYEVGASYRLSTAQSFDLRVFRSDVDGLITTVCLSCIDEDPEPDEFMTVNLDRARNTGLELGYRLRWSDWRLSASGLLQDPKDLVTGEPLPRRAKRAATASLIREFGPHYAGLDALTSGSRSDGAQKLDAYTLLNLTGGLRLGAHFSVDGRVENVLNQDYQTAARYNQPERSFFATVGYTF